MARAAVRINARDSGENAWGEPGLCLILPILSDHWGRYVYVDVDSRAVFWLFFGFTFLCKRAEGMRMSDGGSKGGIATLGLKSRH